MRSPDHTLLESQVFPLDQATSGGFVPSDEIVIRGAREHNLKDVTVSLPRDRLVVITGLSGSGKSSLAFDTLYAEGQRRYVESLSAYARQFLGQMDKPDVDSIDGLSPPSRSTRRPRPATRARRWARSPRSTTTCGCCTRGSASRTAPSAATSSSGQSAEQIVDQVLALPEGTRFTVDAPIVRGRKGEFKDVLEDLRADGFTRVKIDGEQYLLDEPPTLDKQIRHTIVVVVDRLVMKQGLRARLNDSVETALRLAEGLVEVSEVDGATRTYSERFACPDDGISLPELAPRIFSFNSPHGACPRCTGLGTQREIDPELIVPDPSLSIARGGAGALDGDQQRLLRAGDPGHRRPLRDLARDAVAGPARRTAEAVPVRHRRREGVRHLPQPDGPQAQLHAGLRGHRAGPRAPLPRDRLQLPEGADRGVHDAEAVPAVPWRPAQGDEPGRDRRTTATSRSSPSCRWSAPSTSWTASS